ncbi:MAG: zinc ribbon domain-containing protein [Dehalococcoidia bacterium]|nr:MAG: zinc ribbon domain-containing protein [Dehalococcoidia bacterium]
MKCPKCQFDNPQHVKHCVECGAKLERTCPNCQSSNEPSFKFCGECGYDLAVAAEAPPVDLSFKEKLDKISVKREEGCFPFSTSKGESRMTNM